MIYFGIPLRAKGASKNWENVCFLFNRTLRSVFHQACPDFRVFVACHDLPPLTDEYDDRLVFLKAQIRVPSTPEEMMRDKGWKLSMIGMELRRRGGGLYMTVDADDLISDKIAGYAASHPDSHGFYGKYGYLYQEGADYVKKLRKPEKICGSCVAVRYLEEDLPDSMPASADDVSSRDIFPIRMPHTLLADEMERRGRALERVDFPMAIYVQSTGENHSLLSGTQLSAARRAEMLLGRKIPLDRKLRDEFGIRS